LLRKRNVPADHKLIRRHKKLRSEECQLQSLCFCALLTEENDNNEVDGCKSTTKDVGQVPGNVEADLGIDDVGEGNESIEGTGKQRHPCPLCLVKSP